MSNSTEMVERVARAIYGQSPIYVFSLKRHQTYEELSYTDRGIYLRASVAAIQAMREPTQAMLDYANETVRPDSDNAQCPDFYRAMISSAALSPEDEGSQRK